MRHSAIYEGVVRHRRRGPVAHAFAFRMFMVYLDLAELDDAFAGSWTWSTRRPAFARFRRTDYLGPHDVPLDVAVRDRVAAETGRRLDGPVRMLTHLRYFGHVFNPVTFYYCFDRTGERVEAVVAEITNTPWRERRSYVLERRAAQVRTPRGLRFRFAKDFHVSPFLPMDLGYDWTFTAPGERLAVHMNLEARGGRPFDATLQLERREITAARLRGLLVRYPFMTLRVIARIHFEALRLWWKRCPVFPHPARLARRAEATRP